MKDRKDWKPVGSVLNLGFTHSSIWIRARRQSNAAQFIVFRQAMIGEVLHCSGEEKKKAGLDVPVHRWPMKIRYPAFRLDDSTDVSYFRLRSRKVINFPIQVISFPQLLSHIQQRQIVQFSLMASAWISSIFFLAVFWYSPRQLYLLFSLMLMTVSVTLFIIYGDGYLYFWPGSPDIQRAAFNLFSMLGAMTSSLFTRPLLKTWQWTWLDRIILTAISFQGLAALSALIPALDPFFYFVLIAGPFVGVAITVPVAWIRLREGDIPTRYYFAGWLIFLVAFFFNMMVFRGLIDYRSWMAHAPIGAAPFAFLAFALGSYSRLQLEKRQRLRMQERNRLLLEQLEEAHRSMLRREKRDVQSSGIEDTPSGAEEQLDISKIDNSENSSRSEGPVRSQLTGVDVEARKAMLLQAMKEDHLYEVEDLRLEALARHVDLRPHQLSELLNQVLNTSFTEFIRKFRIDAAMKKLGDPECEDSILDIGLAVGFGSKTAFNRSFLNLTGMTPGQYRNECKKVRLVKSGQA